MKVIISFIDPECSLETRVIWNSCKHTSTLQEGLRKMGIESDVSIVDDVTAKNIRNSRSVAEENRALRTISEI